MVVCRRLVRPMLRFLRSFAFGDRSVDSVVVHLLGGDLGTTRLVLSLFGWTGCVEIKKEGIQRALR